MRRSSLFDIHDCLFPTASLPRGSEEAMMFTIHSYIESLPRHEPILRDAMLIFFLFAIYAVRRLFAELRYAANMMPPAQRRRWRAFSEQSIEPPTCGA